MSDYYFEAVRTWQQANRNLKHFAECCANVSGRETAALAADCGLSPDSIEQYRSVYSLYYRNIESEPVRKLWESAPMHIWRAAVKLQARYNLTDDQTVDYIDTGREMTRESFSAHVDERENKLPKWIRVIRDIARSLRRDDWMTEIPHSLRDEYVEKRDALASVLERIAEAVEA